MERFTALSPKSRKGSLVKGDVVNDTVGAGVGVAVAIGLIVARRARVAMGAVLTG
jgi:hypothetical protein